VFAMITKELQVEIEVLHRQGKGIREIARAASVSRNTVRAVLRGSHDGHYGPRTPRPTKVDAYKSTSALG
jgi:transposase